MAKFRPITFNAQRDAVANIASEVLQVPAQLFGLLQNPTGDAAAAQRDATLENVASTITGAWSAETAARAHLQTLLENQDSEHLTEITSPSRPELIPDLRMEATREQPLTGTQTVTFQQTAKSIPIFGTRATVEMDGTTRKLVAVDGVLTDVPDISPVATLSPMQAAERLAQFAGGALDDIPLAEAPALNFFLEEQDNTAQWRLVYVFRMVPLAPTPSVDAAEHEPLHCSGSSYPADRMDYDYLVDANTGEVVFFYSVGAHLDVPVPCSGADVDGKVRSFFGLPAGTGAFHLSDPLRNIVTYDHGFADISTNPSPPFPIAPVQNGSANFADGAPAAVSAHYHAGLVFDFFNNVLKRNSVDDKGMKLESVVNCYSGVRNPAGAPTWRNAQWWRNRMWYGQYPDGNGGYTSTARFLDVIAHELSHGVTQFTAGLVYRDQSGALNESFSDIFGVIIQNWYPGQPNPVSTWTWDIGVGWNGHGTVLRNMKDPTLGGQAVWPQGPAQPAHMNDYLKLNPLEDNGGVHVNSGIHNKAAYLVLTATDAEGNAIFNPQDVAVLYYLTLTRLGALAKFSDCRRTLLNVTTTYFSFDTAVQQEKLQAIVQAYDAVGIV